ncbi:chaperone NapD [Bradyrhizobium sp. JYMT SZCCT0180]|uniref:chaperone NapD n=1 Tax=Bradyrhizobium sp. JYMT SZCCT0180 TaxID=2807666 RepID=UPI001BA54D22|nr:chaperone NapD [Bradyrhizobium sp. JYMT SZCCT0180]MBR1210974.1 chaperone NapD [Bradyrhizobium sp. JYMT SZCCT0180]
MATSHSAIDRRALMTGRLIKPDRVIAPPGGEIAGILVQARPERLAAVEAAILTMEGCEIHGRDPIGKLVVVIDSPESSSLGTTLNNIARLPDVYSASLVFHALDATS